MKTLVTSSIFLALLMAQLGEMDSAPIFPVITISPSPFFWPWSGFNDGLSFNAGISLEKPNDGHWAGNWHPHDDDCEEEPTKSNSKSIIISKAQMDMITGTKKEHPISALSVPMLSMPIMFFPAYNTETKPQTVFVVNPQPSQVVNKVKDPKPQQPAQPTQVEIVQDKNKV